MDRILALRKNSDSCCYWYTVFSSDYNIRSSTGHHPGPTNVSFRPFSLRAMCGERKGMKKGWQSSRGLQKVSDGKALQLLVVLSKDVSIPSASLESILRSCFKPHLKTLLMMCSSIRELIHTWMAHSSTHWSSMKTDVLQVTMYLIIYFRMIQHLLVSQDILFGHTHTHGLWPFNMGCN